MAESDIVSRETDGTLSPGTYLGKYQMVRLLGAGGMGAVYEATHTEIGKRVAIKVLSPSIAAIPGARGRFLREAQLTSRVLHPNIVNVTDMGSENGQTFLVMELFRGEDLAQRIARQIRLSPQEGVDIMLPVCSAVVAAHDAGVTHRDLKPSNIFLAESQHGIEPKILDFGISKSMDAGLGPDALTGTGTVVGTPFYLAPEQVMDNRSAGPASDQYALGVILYECLTGVRPFQSDSLYVVFKDIVAGSPLPPRAHRPEIPDALEQIIMRIMHVDPKGRFETAREMGRSLLPFASNRVRSIWEDAFNAELLRPEALPGGFAGGPGQTGRAVAATRLLTPSADVMPRPPQQGSGGNSGPVGLPGGTQIATPVSASWLRVPKPPDPDIPIDEPAMVDLRPRPSRVWLPLGIALAVVGLAVGGWLLLGEPPVASSTRASGSEPRKKSKKALDLPDTTGGEIPTVPVTPPSEPAIAPQVFQLSLNIQPESALIELDDRPVGRGRLERSLPLDHTAHRLRIAAEGYTPETIEFTDTPPPKQITLDRLESTASVRPERVKPDRARAFRSDGSSRRKRRGGEARSPAQDGSSLPDTARARTLNPNGAPIID